MADDAARGPPPKRMAYGRPDNGNRSQSMDPRHQQHQHQQQQQQQQQQQSQHSQGSMANAKRPDQPPFPSPFGMKLPPGAGGAAQPPTGPIMPPGTTQAMLAILQNLASHAPGGAHMGNGVRKTVGMPSGPPPPPPVPPRMPATLPPAPGPNSSSANGPPPVAAKKLGLEELNVGGKIFTVALGTLVSDTQSLLYLVYAALPPKAQRDHVMMSNLPPGVYFDEERRVFFDRSPKSFRHVLAFLRDERTPQDGDALEVYYEAKYYRIQGLMDWCSRQSRVVSMLVERHLHESMEEEYEQFKQAILQASHHHVTESLKQDLTDSRATIATDAVGTAMPMMSMSGGGGGSSSSAAGGGQQETRSLRTTLLLVLAPFQHANACKKRPNAVPVPPPILAPADGSTPSPPRFEAARFVVGNPQLASHRFISNAASLIAARHRVDIALPYLPGKRLDLLYCLVSQHFAAARMQLLLRPGGGVPGVLPGKNGPGTAAAGLTGQGHPVASEIPCFECGQLFPLYELTVTWWSV